MTQIMHACARPGVITTDDFQNADVLYAETLPAVKAALTRAPGGERAIPVVTGFLGRGINTGGRCEAAACQPELLPAHMHPLLPAARTYDQARDPKLDSGDWKRGR